MRNLFLFSLATVLAGGAFMTALAPKAEVAAEALRANRDAQLCQVDPSFCR